MSLFTVIIGSAYGDDTEANYLVEAATAKDACAYALRIAVAHRERTLSVLRCMEGQVKFCPTIFDNTDNALNEYIPEVIDLRPPVIPASNENHFASVSVSGPAARKMVKWFTSRSLLSKAVKDGGWYKFSLLVPTRMGDTRAEELIRMAFGDTFPKPISTDDEREVQMLQVEHAVVTETVSV